MADIIIKDAKEIETLIDRIKILEGKVKWLEVNFKTNIYKDID